MKKLLLFSAFLLCLIAASTMAQTTPRKSFNRKGYQAWVTLSNSAIVHGLLWSVDSSFVEIKSDQSKKWKSPDSKAQILKIPVEKIQSIRTKKVHAVLKGYGWGAIIGNSLGFAVAIPIEISEPNEGYILIVPMMGLAGSFTGLIAGSLPDRTFKVEGNINNYVSILPDLSKRAFWKW
ncbi:hypothetical protein [Algoriphagus mannitolivorans]|uniref:hypothetical protein n=1 Tax=Algoriphagus mannitolivorans TaxID=226504 RepID=UPI00047C2CA2|nr:hypothetical protein [Algoriphagus mannitolivorans]